MQQALSQTAQAQKTPRSVTRLPAEHIQRVFTRLTASYGRKFTSLFRDEAALESAAQEWAEGLGILSSKQIKHGLDSCRLMSDWNPSIPEFIRLACDLPTVDQVMTRVLDSNCRDLVSYLVRSKIGSYRMNNCSTRELTIFIRGYYTECYRQALEQTAGNDAVFEPTTSLPETVAEEIIPATDEEVEAHLGDIRQCLR